MKLSVVIIAKNEQSNIKDAIVSASFADEILVIDNGSVDDTIKIAKKAKAKVIHAGGVDFSQLRNLGLQKAQYDWIYYLDADERLSIELVEEIEQLVKTNSFAYVAFRIRRQNFYLGENPWPKIEVLERLFKKENLEGWHGELHESPIIQGKVGELKGLLFHYTHRNLTQMLAKTIEWSKVEAQLRFDAGHPKMKMWRFPRVMITAFFDSYIKQEGFRAGTMGFIESIYQSFSIFVTYARLWELQNKNTNK